MHLSLSEEIWSSDPVADSGTGLCVAPVDDDEDEFDDDDDDDDDDLLD